MNHLYIRTDMLRNRNINKIDNAFIFNDLLFRYFPPNNKKTNLFDNEFGDFNFMSNKWIDINNFITENKYGKQGGIGFKTLYSYKYEFIKSKSDHDILIIQLNNPLTKNLLADHNKLVDCLERHIKFNTNDKRFYKYHGFFPNSKSVNPGLFKLDEYKQSYGHNKNKNLKNYDIQIDKQIDQFFGTYAYDDNNIPNKLINKFIVNKDINIQNNILEFFSEKDNKFNARMISFLKKGYKLNSINDIRSNAILPTTMKIAEKTRYILKDKIEENLDKRLFGFRKNRSVQDAIFEINKLLCIG